MQNEFEIMKKLKDRLEEIEKAANGMITVHLHGFAKRAFDRKESFGNGRWPKRNRELKLNPSQDTAVYICGF